MAKLYFYYSAMNAGKTTMLLQAAYNYRQCGIDVLLFVPAVDNRCKVGTIASRIGLSTDALVCCDETNLLSCAIRAVDQNPNVRCLLIDEAQFLTKEQVGQLSRITVDLNIPVLAYGLRSDFQGELFRGSKWLLAWAEELIEIKTICHCGHKATMNLRLDENGKRIREGEQVVIGGNERYVAVCRKHFIYDEDK